jgi:membrane associated rhomboid family serine protease
MAIITELQTLLDSIIANFVFVFGFIAILWIVHIVNIIFRHRLDYFGIYPRRIYGLPGILFYTFLHGDFNHLFVNSFVLFFLANLVLINASHAAFYLISISIILLAGMMIWLIGKHGVHIGASSLIMGYFGYIVTNLWHSGNFVTIVVALGALYFFGYLIFALFPSGEKHISWEGHVCGFLAGIATNYLYPTLLKVVS